MGVVVHMGRAMVMAVGFRGHCITIHALVMSRTRNRTKSGDSLQRYGQQHEAGQEDLPERIFHDTITSQQGKVCSAVNRPTKAPASGVFADMRAFVT